MCAALLHELVLSRVFLADGKRTGTDWKKPIINSIRRSNFPRKPTRTTMKKAVIVAFDQFTDIDVFLAWDLLNRIKMYDSGFEVKIAGTKSSHRSVSGVELATHCRIEEANNADLVYFASGPGTRQLIKNEFYLGRFRLHPQTQVICSICSGSLLLAALGLLDGLTATTYPTSFEVLESYGITLVENAHLVTHDRIATAAGCLAAVDLIGWAIEKLYDEEVKSNVIGSILPVGRPYMQKVA